MDNPVDCNTASCSSLVPLFLFGGFLITVVTFSLYVAGDTVYTDYIRHNPNRTYRETMQTLYVSPFAGFFLSLWNMPLALITGTVSAMIGFRILGRLPFWYLLVMLPLCAVAMCVQKKIVSDYFWDNPVDWMHFVVWVAPHLLMYLLICWWLNRKCEVCINTCEQR
jgi:hypothetical protein